ncbi:hypothetical protein Q6247_27480, partial [Klebsiella pneumoniae]
SGHNTIFIYQKFQNAMTEFTEGNLTRRRLETMTMAMSSFLKLVLGVTMRELLPSLDQDPPEPRQHHRGRIDVEEGH